MKKVWVVQTYNRQHPIVTEYELIEVKEHSIKVNIRGITSTIREANDRYFFYTEEERDAKINAQLDHIVRCAKLDIARVEEVRGKYNIQVIPNFQPVYQKLEL